VARGRRVRRVVRRIDPWSVLKVSVLFFLSLVVVLLVGAVILWSVAQSAGAVGKIEQFMQSLGFDNFKFQGGQIFKVCLFGGLVLCVVGTAFAVILAFLYNLISDLVGGIEIQVIEEESVIAGMDGGPARRPQDGRGRPRKTGSQAPMARRTVV
jgi:transmembrane protein DUF3566